MIKILFVCHGNICRSPMAEFVMKDMVHKHDMADMFMIASAATSTEEIGNDIHHGTKRKLKEANIPFEHHQASVMRSRDYETYDYLIGMDQANIRNMMRICQGDPDHKIYALLDFTDHPRAIADPWYTGNFDETFQDVQEGCISLLQHITNTDM